MKIKLYQIAHSRAGDKGNISTISLIPFRLEDYSILVQKVTAEAVAEHLKGIVFGKITRYEMDNIQALHFVCENSLNGGVTTSTRLDAHGKGLSYALLEMNIEFESLND